MQQAEKYMSPDAQFTHAHMVRFDRLLPGPADKVWSVLTDTRWLPGWYGEGVIEPQVGGKVELMAGHIRGVVTQWRPTQKLAYTWNVFNPGDNASPYPESYLSLTLAPKEQEEIVLTLEHLPVLERFVRLNAMGWHSYLDMVEAAVRGQPVEPRQAYMTRNAKRYGIDLANPLA
jgi:uncharacterized protein YndB with AHSA1/START domain